MAVATLSRKAGDLGMIGGQIIDLRGEKEALSFETLLRLHGMKTGALMECAALLGAYAAGYGADSPEAEAVTTYAARIGLAFQVIDDILDVTASEGDLGKTIGSDASRGKTTFLSFFSLEDAKAYAKRLTDEAIVAVEKLPNSETLVALALYLLERNH